MSNTKLSPAIPQLPSGNIQNTAKFFETKLRFEIVASFPDQGFLILRRGSAVIHFWQAATEEEAKEVGSQSSCYIPVENIEVLFEEFKNAGAPFRYELTPQPWGMNEMQIDDPYGNAIRFGESVANQSSS
jgi:uncharacterized glyoxalase superfamily protein PhnB